MKRKPKAQIQTRYRFSIMTTITTQTFPKYVSLAIFLFGCKKPQELHIELNKFQPYLRNQSILLHTIFMKKIIST